MAVIAINQQIGSGGDELGRLVAAKLGYRFLGGDDIVAEAARRYGVSAEQLKVVDERQPHFWERLATDVGRLVVFSQAVVLKEMAAGRLVTVGRYPALVAPEGGHCVRVRAIGPFAARVAKVAADERLDRAAAERRVREHDREVRARAQHLYGVDLDEPAIYTLILNAATMPVEALTAMLAACAREVGRLRPEGAEVLRDASLAAQVRAAMLAHPQIGKAQVEVECRNGAVHLIGACLVPPWDELAEQVAREVEGVASVEVDAGEPPMPPRPA